MTINGHNEVMKMKNDRNVQIAEFKARLSHYLRGVRRGNSITVVSRDTPVARVVPCPGNSGRLSVRGPTRNAKAVRIPPPLRKRIDSLAALLEERQKGR
jgi:prevent-host-death family protein